MKSSASNAGTPFSYAVPGQVNELLIHNYNDFELWIGGEYKWAKFNLGVLNWLETWYLTFIEGEFHVEWFKIIGLANVLNNGIGKKQLVLVAGQPLIYV